MEILIYVFIFIIGFTIGFIVRPMPKIMGDIVVDETDPEKDLYTFEFSSAPVLMHERKSVIFRIRKKNMH